jgi:carbonic anhydrase
VTEEILVKTLQPTPSEALKRLTEGNQRFVSGVRSVDSIASSMKREQLARNGQTPFAIVLTCSDSRVPAEHVFDAGLGDLFVVRVAGNIVAPSLIASIEFAALSFGTPVCVVMGHSKCGAIQGAVKGALKHQQSLTPNLKILIDELQPAAEQALSTSTTSTPDQLEKLVKTATEINVEHSIDRLMSSSEALQTLQKEGKFQVVGAVYDIESGKVGFLDQDNARLPEKSGESLHRLKVSEKKQRDLDSKLLPAT